MALNNFTPLLVLGGVIMITQWTIGALTMGLFHHNLHQNPPSNCDWQVCLAFNRLFFHYEVAVVLTPQRKSLPEMSQACLLILGGTLIQGACNSHGRSVITRSSAAPANGNNTNLPFPPVHDLFAAHITIDAQARL